MHICMKWKNIHFDWNQTRAFLATVEEGSFSAAARALGTAQPTIGRQIAALEESLHVVLFERVGKKLELTPAGANLLEHARAMGEAANLFALAAAGHSQTLEGNVRITASEVISAFLLPPIIEEIREKHPGITVDIVATNTPSDLLRREADLAVRSFRPEEPDLIARKIGSSRARLYASATYLQKLGKPESLEELSRASFIGFDHKDDLLNGLNALGLSLTRENFSLITANHLVQWEMARRGMGVCIMMEEIGDADPTMRRALENLTPIEVPMWLTSHRELHTSKRVRVVFDILAERLKT